ncbi:DUF3515 domain-containing protein [Polymorphospora rubra]|uniref:Secreted protein n=1 Tax=Polymorphospora rubra TaxID=338584 RepID=A0A810N5H7_9ACTN|nr:DUF3515 domain-containing protein [Polymorphospora rubra]BCJ66933.1 hypothetical protein Prubr_39540 [Polymorphospora rubra]
MVDQITPTREPARGAGPDRTTRQAAIWATVVALPIALLVGLFAFSQIGGSGPVAGPSPSAGTTTAPQPSTPVEMAAPELAERPAVVCRALLSMVPPTLQDLRQRPVSAGAEQNAAYGEPPITVACGVPAPQIPPTDNVWVVSRVCWHSVEQADAMVFTTVDREVPVRVTVPRAYPEALQWLAPLSDSIVESVPSTTSGIPSGCNG